MDMHEIIMVARAAHDAAISVLDQPTTVVPLVHDARYYHLWVPLDEQVVTEDGSVRDLDPVRAGAMHLTLEMLRAGVREFMPLELPTHEVVSYRIEDGRVSIRATCGFVMVPLDGKLPGYRLRIDIAGLKP